jgi:predicted molibdopterin-dependent oxidoreductase YjgC
VFGAGGGTSSYREVRDTDVILLWGSNAREAHPIFFHHVLKAVHAGAELYVVDPRRTTSAQWADTWLGLHVGSDIALANAMAREIIHAGLHNRQFIEHATTGFEAFAAGVEPYTLERAEEITGVPAEVIAHTARTYARADRAQICWTLGITEHHNAVDNVLALINLGLLCGHVGRYGCGLNPLRGQNNVQGGGDMGAIPNRLPGFQDIERNHEARARFEQAWGTSIPAKYGWHMSEMLDAMGRGELTALYVLGENPVQSDADSHHVRQLLEGLEHLVVQDIFRTATAELADVVLPASASWCESEGTVTNSERRVQRVRAALEPPGQARDDLHIIYDLARRFGHDWHYDSSEDVWNELRSLAPNHAGMSYTRLEELGGIQWPCWDEQQSGESFLHGRLWSDPLEGDPAPFHVVEDDPPVDQLSDEFPLLLTTGRRLDSFNTGVQTGGYSSPLRRPEELELSIEDARALGVSTGEQVRVSSRRGSLTTPVRVQSSLRPGLAFMTLHFPDQVETNLLTINATDPKSGTAEFKATAIRVERLDGLADGDESAEQIDHPQQRLTTPVG